MPTGNKAYLIYGWESTFKTEATTKDKVFGRGQKLSTWDVENDVEAIFTVGSKTAEYLKEKQFSGSWGVDAYLSNPWWLKLFFPDVTTVDNGDGSYTHTFALEGKPATATIEAGWTGDVNIVRKLLGCIGTSFTISVRANEIASIRISGVYADEEYSTTLGSQVAETEEAFTFAQGTLEVGGSTVALVQSTELSVNNQAEMIYAIGSRKAQDYTDKSVEVSLTFDLVFKSKDMLEKFYGTAGATTPQDVVEEISTAKIKFTNGKTGADKREIEFDITGMKINRLSSAINPGEIITASIDATCRDIQIVATNSTATPP